MKIEGKFLSQKILEKLKKRKTAPVLAVILIGDNPASLSYIKQKQKAAGFIGAKLVLYRFGESAQSSEIQSLLKKLNDDTKIHGIIIQRPIPARFQSLINPLSVVPQKDVDGFHPESLFLPPVAMAVLSILKHIYSLSHPKKTGLFKKWLKKKKIVVIGRGETGGEPIIKTFEKSAVPYNIIHRQTKNPEKLIKEADIVIPCVGKDNIVRQDFVKKGAILIGVGIHRDTNGKLKGDYNEEKISQTAGFYTPTPGGVGPLNVACLFENLFKAAG